jgi:hypothetical protein
VPGNLKKLKKYRMKKNTLYTAAVTTSQKYLGPAAERFMRRQIDTHLGIKPEELTSKDIPRLVDWTSVAFAMLTDNAAQRESFSKELLALASNDKARSYGKPKA